MALHCKDDICGSPKAKEFSFLVVKLLTNEACYKALVNQYRHITQHNPARNAQGRTSQDQIRTHMVS